MARTKSWASRSVSGVTRCRAVGDGAGERTSESERDDGTERRVVTDADRRLETGLDHRLHKCLGHAHAQRLLHPTVRGPHRLGVVQVEGDAGCLRSAATRHACRFERHRVSQRIGRVDCCLDRGDGVTPRHADSEAVEQVGRDRPWQQRARRPHVQCVLHQHGRPAEIDVESVHIGNDAFGAALPQCVLGHASERRHRGLRECERGNCARGLAVQAPVAESEHAR